MTFKKKKAGFGNFCVTRQLLCFQIITGLQLKDCELMDGNEHPIACRVDASIQGKARHRDTHYPHVQLFRLIVI